MNARADKAVVASPPIGAFPTAKLRISISLGERKGEATRRTGITHRDEGRKALIGDPPQQWPLNEGTNATLTCSLEPWRTRSPEAVTQPPAFADVRGPVVRVGRLSRSTNWRARSFRSRISGRRRFCGCRCMKPPMRSCACDTGGHSTACHAAHRAPDRRGIDRLVAARPSGATLRKRGKGADDHDHDDGP
jgi:hypothetical protein